MGLHGSGWYSYLRSTDEKPRVTWDLLKRVMAYSQPYRSKIILMLGMILLNAGLTLLTPLILRRLIDEIIPQGQVDQLVLMAFALLLIPALGGVISVFQRNLNASIGEGVIYDLRVALFASLQRMSLRFFTNTKVGELMSRLNNDVIGAQNAISNTIVGMVTNVIQARCPGCWQIELEFYLTSEKYPERTDKATVELTLDNWEVVDVVSAQGEVPSENLTFEEALVIAQNSDCVKKGTLTDSYVYNEYTRTWWIDLDPVMPHEGCNPACVVDENARTAEVNWRCTGLIPE